MRAASWIAAALFCTASPALATSTILCRSTISPTDGPALSLVVGNGTGILQARFELDRIRFATSDGSGAAVIGQAWIDEHSLRIDIVDANAEGRLVRLDTRRRSGPDYRGILVHAGRTWRVRCGEEG
ncbi:MAG TPA: hypothetical protein VMS43_06765 [Allosphingosinicella sp.]|nr:hypothetical protein [Allosphingosinicella sp.]